VIKLIKIKLFLIGSINIFRIRLNVIFIFNKVHYYIFLSRKKVKQMHRKVYNVTAIGTSSGDYLCIMKGFPVAMFKICFISTFSWMIFASLSY